MPTLVTLYCYISLYCAELRVVVYCFSSLSGLSCYVIVALFVVYDRPSLYNASAHFVFDDHFSTPSKYGLFREIYAPFGFSVQYIDQCYHSLSCMNPFPNPFNCKQHTIVSWTLAPSSRSRRCEMRPQCFVACYLRQCSKQRKWVWPKLDR